MTRMVGDLAAEASDIGTAAMRAGHQTKAGDFATRTLITSPHAWLVNQLVPGSRHSTGGARQFFPAPRLCGGDRLARRRLGGTALEHRDPAGVLHLRGA